MQPSAPEPSTSGVERKKKVSNLSIQDRIDILRESARSLEDANLKLREVSPDDIETLAKVHSLIAKTFKEAEVDPWDDFITCVKGVTPEGVQLPVRYNVFVVEKEYENGGSQEEGENRIEALYVTGLTPLIILEDGKEIPTNELIFSGFYILTTNEGKGKGSAANLYISALESAMEHAKRESKQIVLAVGDVTDGAKRFWESMGRRQLFLQNLSNKKNVELTQVPYTQPSLDEDMAEEGAPENLMLELFGDTKLTRELVLSVVRTLYWWTKQQMAFSKGEADGQRRAFNERLDIWLDEYKIRISQPGDLVLLGQAQIDSFS